MKRFILVLAGVLLLTILGTAAASANGGPHGGYTSTGGEGGGLPDQCAACHRIHQGQSVGKLLKANTQYALCLTCHNGAGSRLDVLDGVKLGATVSNDSGVIRQADAGQITASVIPDAALSTGAGGNTSFTLAVRNRGLTTTLTLAITDSNIVAFDPSAITTTPGFLSVPAAGPTGIPGVAYARFTTKAKVGAAAEAINVSTITVTESLSSSVATVAVETRVASAADTTSSTYGSQYGSNTLNGGGFRYINGAPVTSRHNADPADNTLQPWGYQTNTGLKSGNLSSPLQCTSCHNPHGTNNYRLLKETLNASYPLVRVAFNASGATTTLALMKDEGGPGLSPVLWQPSDKYTKEYYASSGDGGTGVTGSTGPQTGTGNGIASLCGACHEAYPSTGAGVPNNQGGVTHFKHVTEKSYLAWANPELGQTYRLNPETGAVAPGNTGGDTGVLTGFPRLRLAPDLDDASATNTVVSCLTCHRVHGSSSTMSGYALMKTIGGTSTGGLGDDTGVAALTPSQMLDETMPGGMSTSTLLYTNNRGMCQACHQW